MLAQYSESNLDFVKAEGFTSIQLSIDPRKVDDAAILGIKIKIQQSGLYVSSLAVDGNHIDPDPAARDRQNTFTIQCIEICGKLGIPNIAGQSGKIVGRPLQEQVDEIVKVYNENYFPLCEKYKVHSLGTVRRRTEYRDRSRGLGSAVQGVSHSPNVGLQFDPSHLVWQLMDPVQAARDFVAKIYDVHLKDTEILWHVLRRRGIQPVNNERWWRFRVPGYGSMDWKGFFSVLAEAGIKAR